MILYVLILIVNNDMAFQSILQEVTLACLRPMLAKAKCPDLVWHTTMIDNAYS